MDSTLDLYKKQEEVRGFTFIRQDGNILRFSKKDIERSVHFNDEGKVIYTQDNYPVYFAHIIK